VHVNEIQEAVSLWSMAAFIGELFRDASLNNFSLMCFYGRMVLNY
jgi:hypothetical protein